MNDDVPSAQREEYQTICNQKTNEPQCADVSFTCNWEGTNDKCMSKDELYALQNAILKSAKDSANAAHHEKMAALGNAGRHERAKQRVH